MARGGRGGRPGRPTNAAKKRGTAASTSWWKRGAATTRARMRKTGRIGLHEGGCSFGHDLTRCRKATEGRCRRGAARRLAAMEGSMSEGELERLRRVVERLMAGHREALGVIDQEVEDQESSAQQETLAEVQDILSGALEDARTILGGEER